MVDLTTNYMGIPMRSPIVVGACTLSNKVDDIKMMEEFGAGGIVIKSLFEEQIQRENASFDAARDRYDNRFLEALSMFPKIEYHGAREHLFWIERTRKAVKMPIIGSLNCVNSETWVEYAKAMECAGVDGLELNFYSQPLDPNMNSRQIEEQELEIFQKVRSAVKSPLSIKIHPYYTSLMNVVSNFDQAGAQAFVIFNRMFHSDISLEHEELIANRKVTLSEPRDGLDALRWTALLHGHIKADIISSSGVSSGNDMIKMMLAGATAVQAVSIFYKEHMRHIRIMNEEAATWMEQHNYQKLADFRGKIAKTQKNQAWTFERAQYVKAVTEGH